MGFVGVVTLIGAVVLYYQQNRFVPPRFPESDMIDTLSENLQDQGSVLASEGEANIRITGAASDSGFIKIAIYESEASFNQVSEAILARSVELTDGEANLIVTTDELPKRIAIAAYHDENGDGMLNRNRFGIPVERYGFSRNARGIIGPPTFDQTVIQRPNSGSLIDIFVR